MSLILDALRKADAERERGSVPSLHSHPVASPSIETPRSARPRPSWPWVAIGVAVGLAGAVAWMSLTRDRAPAVAPAAPTTPAAAGVAAAPPSAPGAMAGGAAPGSATAAAPAAEPAPWPLADDRKGSPPMDAPPVTYLGNVPPPGATVLTREQLPPEIRGALPPLTIGGSIYSPNPGDRSLIVNGQLFRERDRLTQDLSLDEIRLKAAVFSFRGYRFEMLF